MFFPLLLPKRKKQSRNQLNAHAPHIQEQLICLNAAGTAPIVGSWWRGRSWQLGAAAKFSFSWREAACCLHTPCCLLYPGATHSSYAIMGNAAKRAA